MNDRKKGDWELLSKLEDKQMVDKKASVLDLPSSHLKKQQSRNRSGDFLILENMCNESRAIYLLWLVLLLLFFFPSLFSVFIRFSLFVTCVLLVYLCLEYLQMKFVSHKSRERKREEKHLNIRNFFMKWHSIAQHSVVEIYDDEPVLNARMSIKTHTLTQTYVCLNTRFRAQQRCVALRWWCIASHKLLNFVLFFFVEKETKIERKRMKMKRNSNCWRLNPKLHVTGARSNTGNRVSWRQCATAKEQQNSNVKQQQQERRRRLCRRRRRAPNVKKIIRV